MATINAQTIIAAVMQAHAIAPSEPGEYMWDYKCFQAHFIPHGFEDMNESTGDYETPAESAYSHLIKSIRQSACNEVADLFEVPRKIKFQTAAKGFHTIQNCKANLQRFADAVRKNAAAFGGGIVRIAKPKPSVSYPSKSISLFKQLIEDHDYSAALDLASDKLDALFFVDNKGKAWCQVAPVPVDTMPGLFTAMNESGTYSIIEPISMRSLGGGKRSRAAQIEACQRQYDTASPENKARILDEAEAKRVDQFAIRAQWMLEHGIIDAEAIAARIEADKLAREESARHAVAQVVAQAVAAVAITEAMQPSEAAEVRELVTCEADESEAQGASVGSAGGFTVAAYDRVMGALNGFTPAAPIPRVVEFLGDATPTPMESTGQNKDHLMALINRCADERAMMEKSKSDDERKTRAAIVAQIEKEIQGEYAFLGMPTSAEMANVDDDALLADLATSTPTVAEFLPAKMAYSLPAKSVYEDWRGAEYGDFTPDSRQQMVIDAVTVALDEKRFYTTDVLARCIELLNIDAATASIKTERVEGGDVGTDVYYARGHVEAKKRREASKIVFDQMRLQVGDELGILVFTDFKRTTGVKITGQDGSGFTFTGKRGAYTVSGTGSADQFKCAIERAFSTGKRKTDYPAFVAGRPAPTPPSVESQPVAPTPAAEFLEETQARREMDDEMTYARQRAYSPHYMGSYRTPSLIDYFAKHEAEKDAHYAALRRVWEDSKPAESSQAAPASAPNSEGERIRAAADKMRGKFPAIAARYDDLATAHDLKDEREAGEALVTAALDRLMPETVDVPAVTQASEPAPSLRGEWLSAQVSRADSKSAKWTAWIFVTSTGAIALGFSKQGQTVELSTYPTARDRMAALQAMARAADAPDDTPPTGGLPDDPMAPVAPSTPTPGVAISSEPAKMKIADIRKVIDFCDWVRNDFGGATASEFKAMDVPGRLTPHIEAVKALEIPPRFTKDIEHQAWAIECAQKAIARWQSKQ